MKDYKVNLPAYRYTESLKRLRNHDCTIQCFARHLSSETWPTDDKAVAQRLTKMKHWIVEGTDQVMLLQSKHLLDCVLEEEEERSHCKRARGSGGAVAPVEMSP